MIISSSAMREDRNILKLVSEALNKVNAAIGSVVGLEAAFASLVMLEGLYQDVREKMQRIEKYKLIHTHTARRTGATLMYLSGMDIYDIMKITGHSSPAMLKKYIKADQLEVASKIEDKYDYFK